MMPIRNAGRAALNIKQRGEVVARLEGARVIATDHGQRDVTTYCEARHEADGSITILDIYELPDGA